MNRVNRTLEFAFKSKNDKMISVIIPTYNRSEFVTKAIISVFEQKCDFFIQIIIVDDGSTDHTKDNVYSLSPPANCHINYLYQENKGVSAARNLGLKHAKGEYIQFLDSDDYLDCYKFDKQIELLESGNYDFCTCLSEHVYEGSNRKAENFKFRRLSENWKTDVVYNNLWPVHAPIYRTEFIQTQFCFNEKLYCLEDWEISILFSLSDAKIINENSVLCYIREHEEGSSERLSKVSIEKVLNALAIVSKSILRGIDGSSLGVKDICKIRFLLFKKILSGYRNSRDISDELNSKFSELVISILRNCIFLFPILFLTKFYILINRVFGIKRIYNFEMLIINKIRGLF